MPFSFIAPNTLNYVAFQSFDFDRPDGGYSRNASPALYLISTILFESQSVSKLLFLERNKNNTSITSIDLTPAYISACFKPGPTFVSVSVV